MLSSPFCLASFDSLLNVACVPVLRYRIGKGKGGIPKYMRCPAELSSFVCLAGGSIPLGRPRGRRLYWRFRAFAVSSVHSNAPNGRSRRTDSRIICRSRSDVTALTLSTQSVPRGTVPGSSRIGAGIGAASQRRLDHGHSSARPTSPARSGLRSMYRKIANKCSSSWIENTLNRPCQT